MFGKITEHGRSTLLTAAVSIAALAGSALPVHPSAQAASDRYAHIFFIMMENEGTAQIYGNTADAPYINTLVGTNASAENYFGVTHPSLPNYLAMLSGSSQGIWDDCPAGASITCAPGEFNGGSPYYGTLLTPSQVASATAMPHLFKGPTLVDQLETHSLTWKAYMESVPSAGFTGAAYPPGTVAGTKAPLNLYQVKHNPFIYFSSIVGNPARLQKVVPFTQLATDLSSNQVPNFVWVSPNLCNDMHGLSPVSAKGVGIPKCGYPASGISHGAIQIGDNFLKTLVPQIMASHAWQQKSAIVIAFDENDYSGYKGCCQSPRGVNGITLGGGHAPFITILSQGAHHLVDGTPYNHYTFLATIEHLWGLGCLNETCKVGPTGLMSQFFQ